jgi:Mitochondrial ribosomal protein S23.
MNVSMERLPVIITARGWNYFRLKFQRTIIRKWHQDTPLWHTLYQHNTSIQSTAYTRPAHAVNTIRYIQYTNVHRRSNYLCETSKSKLFSTRKPHPCITSCAVHIHHYIRQQSHNNVSERELPTNPKYSQNNSHINKTFLQ